MISKEDTLIAKQFAVGKIWRDSVILNAYKSNIQIVQLIIL
ncbi:hypothetical protein SAMN05421786_11355 [Chryseobacterium ureilyticum]|uniref:Uncharacterized protein n=1 Tax=Chryseobacterium ureilyticum TaxID=373668 RepID=A0A1N7QNN5_9FLAO|nr:hypothetical protein SAMN05421786_11355 [Chryseobacterium ureilyticum]